MAILLSKLHCMCVNLCEKINTQKNWNDHEDGMGKQGG